MSSERFLELQTETKPRAGVSANSLRIVRIVDFASPRFPAAPGRRRKRQIFPHSSLRRVST